MPRTMEGQEIAASQNILTREDVMRKLAYSQARGEKADAELLRKYDELWEDAQQSSTFDKILKVLFPSLS